MLRPVPGDDVIPYGLGPAHEPDRCPICAQTPIGKALAKARADR